MAKLFFRYIPDTKYCWHYIDDNGNEREGIKETCKFQGEYACEYATLKFALDDVRELLDGSQLELYTCNYHVGRMMERHLYGGKQKGKARQYVEMFERLLQGIDYTCEFLSKKEMGHYMCMRPSVPCVQTFVEKQEFNCYGVDIVLEGTEFEDNENHYVAYTDGSADYSNGFGGAAYVILKDGKMLAERSKGNRNTTNNRQEIMAIVSALNYVPVGCCIDIYTDSQYAIYFFTQKLSLKAKNLDLKKQLPKYTSGKKIRFHWVKGHNGNHWNERADYLANKAYKDICKAYGVQ